MTLEQLNGTLNAVGDIGGAILITLAIVAVSVFLVYFLTWIYKKIGGSGCLFLSFLACVAAFWCVLEWASKSGWGK